MPLASRPSGSFPNRVRSPPAEKSALKDPNPPHSPFAAGFRSSQSTLRSPLVSFQLRVSWFTVRRAGLAPE